MTFFRMFKQDTFTVSDHSDICFYTTLLLYGKHSNLFWHLALFSKFIVKFLSTLKRSPNSMQQCRTPVCIEIPNICAITVLQHFCTYFQLMLNFTRFQFMVVCSICWLWLCLWGWWHIRLPGCGNRFDIIRENLCSDTCILKLFIVNIIVIILLLLYWKTAVELWQ